MSYDYIALIYNPQSTGHASKLARELAVKLKRTKTGQSCDIKRYETEYAGHGRALAREIAMQYSQPLIVSVSGDGGYHDVINGVYDAAREKGGAAQAVTDVVPAGNANDHHRAIKGRALEDIIDDVSPAALDVLEVTMTHQGETSRRIAHSYVGFGVTARAANKLNHIKGRWWREVWTVLKTIHYFPGINLQIDGRAGRFDSLIAANISQMAKVVTVASQADPTDGRLELTLVPHSSRWRFYMRLLRTMVQHESDARTVSSAKIQLQQAVDIQLDGEVISCPSGTVISLIVLPHFLRELR